MVLGRVVFNSFKEFVVRLMFSCCELFIEVILFLLLNFINLNMVKLIKMLGKFLNIGIS